MQKQWQEQVQTPERGLGLGPVQALLWGPWTCTAQVQAQALQQGLVPAQQRALPQALLWVQVTAQAPGLVQVQALEPVQGQAWGQVKQRALA